MTDKNELLNHNYDGIREYDNDLPRWWVYLFWVTIIYGVAYAYYFHSGTAPQTTEQLAFDMAALKSQSAIGQPESSISDEKLATIIADPMEVAKGREIFTAKCAACHGPAGQGLIGPNLTDKFWIHGGRPSQVRNTIVNGVPEKGMLAWKGMMTETEISATVAFIESIKNSNPPNPKEPQGVEVDS